MPAQRRDKASLSHSYCNSSPAKREGTSCRWGYTGEDASATAAELMCPCTRMRHTWFSLGGLTTTSNTSPTASEEGSKIATATVYPRWAKMQQSEQ